MTSVLKESVDQCEYEADDCDNYGKGLRAADYQRIQHRRE